MLATFNSCVNHNYFFPLVVTNFEFTIITLRAPSEERISSLLAKFLNLFLLLVFVNNMHNEIKCCDTKGSLAADLLIGLFSLVS